MKTPPWVFIAVGAFLLLSGGTILYTATRGLRNNNPGNIRRNNTRWVGASPTQNDSDFVTFNSPEYGIRALYRTLMTYRNNGASSVHDIISRWAPSTENDTVSYINAVSSNVGVNPNDTLSLQQYPALIEAIIKHENGVQPYPDSLIHQGIALA